MQYLCLVYHDEKALDALSRSEYTALMRDSIAYHEELRLSGHYISAITLKRGETATSLRIRNSRVSIADGPFVETREHLSGYTLIEARDLNEAIRVASKIPSARLGGVEVRPVIDCESN